MFAPGTVQTTEGSLCPESGFTPKTMPLQKHHCETAFMFFCGNIGLPKNAFLPRKVIFAPPSKAAKMTTPRYCSAIERHRNVDALRLAVQAR